MGPNKATSYCFANGVRFKNTFNKITTTINNNNINLQTNNNNNNVKFRIEDTKMLDGEIFNIRKKQKCSPLIDLNNANNIQIQQQNCQKVKRLKSVVKDTTTTVTTANISTGSNKSTTTILSVVSGNGNQKKSTSQPQAVARRNARERNRVKQVNNGFAALRQHIPNEIAEAYEASGNGRGSAKKFSKVETLRMAVEYIRSLEKLLNIDNTNKSQLQQDNFILDTNENCSTTKTVIKKELCSSPIIMTDDYNQFSNENENFDNCNEITSSNEFNFDDTLPDIATVNGQQYIRIPGTNAYQLVVNEMYENDENMKPLVSDYDYSVIELNPQIKDTSDTAATMTTLFIQNPDDILTEINPVLGSPSTSSSSLLNGHQGCDSQQSLSPANHLQHEHHQQQLQHQQQQYQEQELFLSQLQQQIQNASSQYSIQYIRQKDESSYVDDHHMQLESSLSPFDEKHFISDDIQSIA